MKPSSRLVSASVVLLACTGTVLADDTISGTKIKVQLFAAPSFLSEVSVDAYNNQCLSLDNNLYVAHLSLPRMIGGVIVLTQSYSIDGRVQSILVGGHDVQAVLNRDDYWSCRFYE